MESCSIFKSLTTLPIELRAGDLVDVGQAQVYPDVHYDLIIRAVTSIRGSIMRMSVVGTGNATAISQLVVLLAGKTTYRFSFPAPDEKVSISFGMVQEKSPVTIQSLQLTSTVTSFAPRTVFRVCDIFSNEWKDLPVEQLESGRYSIQDQVTSQPVLLSLVVITEPTGALITANYIDPTKKRSSACADHVDYHGNSSSHYYTLITEKECIVKSSDDFLSQTYLINHFREYLDRYNLAYLIN
jgi:hypothetical protein